MVIAIIGFLTAITGVDADRSQGEQIRNVLFLLFWGTVSYLLISSYILSQRSPTLGDVRFFRFGISIPLGAVLIYFVLQATGICEGILN